MNEVPPKNSGASKTRGFPWPWPFLAIVLCVSVLFVGYFVTIPLQVVYKADAGFRKAKEIINPEQLRAWALESIKSYSGTNGYSQDIAMSEIPNYITNLYSIPPEKAWVNPKTSESEAYVMIMWGGGFFHWGFYIGGTNYSMEPFGNHEIAEWTSGIYYMHEGSRKIR
jgi:hypothetical protein